MRPLVEDFLAQKKIAVAGVSRSGAGAANLIYRKLRGAGYRVFAVNPNAQQVEGDSCYPDLKSLPEAVDAVVIVTHPQVTEQLVRDCQGLGIRRVWIHRSFGQGSISASAIDFCREHGIEVIPGGCPMMHCKPVDLGHRCMKWFLGVTGGLPRQL